MKLALTALLAGFFLCFIVVRCSIPLLKKLKAGQPILKYVKEHAKKSGTPMSTAGVKQTSCLFVKLKRTFDLIFERSLGIGFLINGFSFPGTKKTRLL